MPPKRDPITGRFTATANPSGFSFYPYVSSSTGFPGQQANNATVSLTGDDMRVDKFSSGGFGIKSHKSSSTTPTSTLRANAKKRWDVGTFKTKKPRTSLSPFGLGKRSTKAHTTGGPVYKPMKSDFSGTAKRMKK